jgi:signal transduction histidine kinase
VLKRRVALLEAQSAVQRERLRLARDLHDEVGSGLGRVVLFAGEARRKQDDPAALAAALDRVRDSAQELVQHAREIVWAVSPQHDALDHVVERLGDYADETLRAAGIACRLETPPPDQLASIALGSEARHNLFLAVKEAVHNCVKYSGAKTAEFRLEVVGSDFVITLRDHGSGFAPGERRGTGHGIRNIQARVQALGGTAAVTSAVGEGTTVLLRVPLTPRPPRNLP